MGESSSVDVWGGNRQPVDHKYNSSVLLMQPQVKKSGLIKLFTIRDFDLPMQPSLVDFPMQNGQNQTAVVIGTKSGQFFVLDRADRQAF